MFISLVVTALYLCNVYTNINVPQRIPETLLLLSIIIISDVMGCIGITTLVCLLYSILVIILVCIELHKKARVTLEG